MRGMAATTANMSQPPRIRRLIRLRIWVQAAFLGVWLAPVAFLRGVPGCVFHCYACPLSSFGCPVGLAAGAAALHMVPLIAIGMVVTVAALVGSLVCGWACPFGLLQDVAAKLPTPKFRLPNWTGGFRYVVLLGLVIVGPYLFGKAPGQLTYICNVCPVGGLEAGLPRMAAGQVPLERLGGSKYVVLYVLAGFMLFTHRPWCKVLCPLGGVLAMFNRFSVFHIRFDRDACTECNLCRSRCMMGVRVEEAVNTGNCIRCLECTRCGARKPTLASSPSPKQDD